MINNNLKVENITPEVQPSEVQPPEVQPPEVQPPEVQPSKLDPIENDHWGKIIWELLHTMTEKMNEKNFYEYREDILYIIYCICTTLPCEGCNQHSIDYLDNKTNFLENIKDEADNKIINNKEELRIFLLDFHNNVNKMNNIPLFTVEECISKYSSNDILICINNYIKKSSYFMRHGYNKLIKYLLEKNLKHFL
jgi:hypothetical protein